MKHLLLALAALGFASPAFARHEGNKKQMMKKRMSADQIMIKNNTKNNFERVSVKVVFQGQNSQGYNRTHEGYLEIPNVKAGASVKANLSKATVDRCHHRMARKNHECGPMVLGEHYANDLNNVRDISVRFISAGSMEHGINEVRTRGNFSHSVFRNGHGTNARSFVIEGKAIRPM